MSAGALHARVATDRPQTPSIFWTRRRNRVETFLAHHVRGRLDAQVRRVGDLTNRGQRAGVGLAQLLEQARGAFDIGRQE
jgi:hypothetical protein